MKLKTLRKKIRRLETRLQEGPKKLARLKRKLEALVTADAEKAKRKLAARAAEARQTMKSAPPAQDEQSQSAAKKVKKKLNLSPERRAQLAAAMKARWAAKRAAMAAKPQNNSPERNFTPGQVPQAP